MNHDKKNTFLYDKSPSFHWHSWYTMILLKNLKLHFWGLSPNDPKIWGLSVNDPKNWGLWNTRDFTVSGWGIHPMFITVLLQLQAYLHPPKNNSNTKYPRSWKETLALHNHHFLNGPSWLLFFRKIHDKKSSSCPGHINQRRMNEPAEMGV